jgi:hypothetical protein
VELRPAGHADIATMRHERTRGASLSLMPGFYSRLADEARPFLILDRPVGGETGGAGESSVQGEPLGYALLLERPHGSHSHVTLVEMYVEPGRQHRYEDALDLIREQQKPTAYLVRTDDCLLSAGLLARGLQVEPTALVMLPGDGSGPAAATGGAAPEAGLGLETFVPSHLPEAEALLAAQEQAHRVHHAGHTHGGGGESGTESGADIAEQREELRLMAHEGRGWAIIEDGRPVAVIARRIGEDRVYELLDFAVARAPEAHLAWGLRQATAVVRAADRRPAAVIDALETVRRRVFREAGYHTAAAYVVFYDPEAGRPSIGVLGLEALRAMMESGEQFRLVDVMGEEHWKKGYLPGAEWLDFRGLAKEARRRYQLDETIVLYCNGFT